MDTRSAWLNGNLAGSLFFVVEGLLTRLTWKPKMMFLMNYWEFFFLFEILRLQWMEL